MSLLLDKYYRIGETGILLRSPRFTERETLRMFACDELRAPDTRIEISVNDRISVPERGGIIQGDSERFYSGTECITVVRNSDNRILWKTQTAGKDIFAEIAPDRVKTLNTYEILRICDLPRAFLLNGAVILHASFIEYEGKAVLFAGDKQAGKSTQAALWEKYAGARVINGDRALLENKNGVWYASGLPFCGTSGICKNDSFPVRAVVMLSKSSVNRIMPAAKTESVFFLARQCAFERTSQKQSKAFFDIAEQLVGSVPFLSFSCLPDSSAVTALRDALTEW